MHFELARKVDFSAVVLLLNIVHFLKIMKLKWVLKNETKFYFQYNFEEAAIIESHWRCVTFGHFGGPKRT